MIILLLWQDTRLVFIKESRRKKACLYLTESVKSVNKYLVEIVEVPQNIMNDESATSETKSDPKQLFNRISTYDFLTLQGFWNLKSY